MSDLLLHLFMIPHLAHKIPNAGQGQEPTKHFDPNLCLLCTFVI